MIELRWGWAAKDSGNSHCQRTLCARIRRQGLGLASAHTGWAANRDPPGSSDDNHTSDAAQGRPPSPQLGAGTKVEGLPTTLAGICGSAPPAILPLFCAFPDHPAAATNTL